MFSDLLLICGLAWHYSDSKTIFFAAFIPVSLTAWNYKENGRLPIPANKLNSDNCTVPSTGRDIPMTQLGTITAAILKVIDRAEPGRAAATHNS